MKIIRVFIMSFFSLILFSCEKEFLDVEPQDQLVDESYWTSEKNIETFAYGFYPAYFQGYGSGYAWGDYFTGEVLVDDFAPTNPPKFTIQVPTSGGGWTFEWVRKANIFIDRVSNSPIEEEAKEHWVGIGRFFRALEYYDLVRRFGDIQYYDRELEENELEELYKPRDSREFVMDKVLEDFQYAVEHVRESGGAEGLTVDKDVVLAFMSRVFLFEGTWQKYHEENTEKAREYLEAAQGAAKQVIDRGNFSLADYRDTFSALDLGDNPEVILYREYESGILMHALMSYNNSGESQTGVSKDAIDAYLGSDGLPISLSDVYQGDKGIDNVMANRDPRLYETVVPYELRLNGIAPNYSTTGFATHKFLNEEIKDETIAFSNINPSDAPVIRYGEVLLNYIEATAELATLGGPAVTQADLDISINVLRSRPGINMPPLQILGGQPAVNGQVYDDPERDPSVPSLLWEIRRERRIELMMEGFRDDDLQRWMKYEYLDMIENPEINRGAWIDKSDYDATLTMELTEGDEGYIIPATSETSIRTFDDPRVYLNPIPLDQLTLYRDFGAELEQNPGWE